MSHNKQQFDRLVEIADNLKEQTILKTAQRVENWRNSPFEWLAARWVPPGTKGLVGRNLVRGLCNDDPELCVERYRKGDRTKIRVSGCLISVKFSLLGEDNNYLFQNIKDSGYNFLFCLGVSPSNAHAWVLPIERIKEAKDQHGRADKWINSVDPQNPPKILCDCDQNGDITRVCEIFRKYLKS